MRIGVARTQVPFISGGAERHAARLVAALNAYGHEATEITIPFKWYPAETLVDHIEAAKRMDVSAAEGAPIDMMIGLKFPAYLMRHENPVFWILHQHRRAYDMWDSDRATELLDNPKGLAVKQRVEAEDRAAFARSRRPIFANSQNVAKRLQDHLGITAQPLYHPPPLAERFYTESLDGPLFAPGRLNRTKRVDLMLRALQRTPASVHLEIAGEAATPEELTALQSLADQLGVGGRVHWLGRIDDEALLAHYARARAVVFTPTDEDYGYIALEAMLARKPVITVSDAGGPLEFIRDGQEGLVTAPDPAELGRAMTVLWEDPTRAETMGQGGRARYDSLDIRWDHVIEALTGEPATSAAAFAPLPTEAPQALPPVNEPEAVAALKAAVAPPPPPDIPFASIEDVLTAFQFDEADYDPGLAKYLGTHWTRYLTTLAHVIALKPRRVLDVGVFPPLVFEAMIAAVLTDVEMAGLWEGPHPFRQAVTSRTGEHPNFTVDLGVANIETDRMPFEDESFDLVLGMEIFEHLALDPHFFLSECARVLAPGGHLLMTTPNVVSHRGVEKALTGRAPYSFGLFVPTGGVYGRHNREYAPPELDRLGQSAGFETHHLSTADVYEDSVDPGTAGLLHARGDNLALRGENIIYVGRKSGPPGPPPAGVYHGEPRSMSGALSVLSHEPETGLVQIEARNRSSIPWPHEGPHALAIHATWVNADGWLVHSDLYLPLSAPVLPGERTTLSLRLDAESEGAGQGTLTLDLFQTGVGGLSGTGRANQLRLACSEAAYLRLRSAS